MIFCYCYSSSNAANMKGGEVETVTVDKKKKTYFTLYQTKKGIIDSESTCFQLDFVSAVKWGRLTF